MPDPVTPDPRKPKKPTEKTQANGEEVIETEETVIEETEDPKKEN